MGNSRRTFLKQLGFGLVALPAISFLRAFPGTRAWAAPKKTVPLPAGAQAVSESDAVASAIGFRHDVSKVDFAKYPQRKKADAKNQFCKNCALYTAQNEGWGKCQMLTNGLVNADGWCGSWNKKG